MGKIQKTRRRKIFEVIEMGLSGSRAASLFDGFMVGLITLNVAAVSLETVPEISDHYSHLLIAFEIFSLIVFSIEYFF